MKQVVSRISTYSSDEFGVCSALYELGGMVVIHDASGCNSTYTTHDEPRWYDMDSMIFISAISEMEAIMGDDEKFISDLVESAQELKPAFVALVGAPIPYMIGTDLDAIAVEVERRTGIPAFAFETNGMEYYTKGVSMAFVELVKRYVITEENIKSRNIKCHALDNRIIDDETVNDKDIKDRTPGTEAERIRVNILGATPLDFSINGTIESIKEWIKDNGMENGACLAMGDSLENIKKAGLADVNLVVSTGGFEAALLMEEKLGIPYVVGVPYGLEFSKTLAEKVKEAAVSGQSCIAYDGVNISDVKAVVAGVSETGKSLTERADEKRAIIIGEAVTSSSLAVAISLERGIRPQVLCPLGQELVTGSDQFAPEEDDIVEAVKAADIVIADSLYSPICENVKFYELPHVAFSGRIHEDRIPNLIGVKIC